MKRSPTASTSSATLPPPAKKAKAAVPLSDAGVIATPPSTTARSQEEADAAYAQDLAKKEGIDLAALKAEEQRREKQRAKGKAKVELGSDDDDDDEIIFVDAPAAKKSPAKPVATATTPVRLASIFKSPAAKPKPAPPPTPSPRPAIKTEAKPVLPGGSNPFSNLKTTKRPTIDPNDKPLDTTVFTFEPLRDINSAGWPNGRMPFAVLVQAYVMVSATRSRLLIDRVLCNLFRVLIEHDPASLIDVVFLTSNTLGPAHQGIELGFGTTALMSAIKKVSNVSPATWKKACKTGDPGDTAFLCKAAGQKQLVTPPPLICHSTFATLLEISRLKGTGSLELKSKLAIKLLAAAQGEEVRFMTRILAQNLRLGATGKTITKALARAFCLSRPTSSTSASAPYDPFFIDQDLRDQVIDSESSAKTKSKGKGKAGDDSSSLDARGRMERAEASVRAVWAVHPNFRHIVEALLEGGLVDLDRRVPISIGTPIQSMLGKITRSIDEVYERLGDRPFVSEAKVDGQRIQIHVAQEAPVGESGKGRWYEGEDGLRYWYRFFSKKHEDITEKYPDLAPTIGALIRRESTTSEPLESFIIDSEIAAIETSTGHVLPFQELAHRKRKDVEESAVTIRVSVFHFDLLLLNGRSLLPEPFRARRTILRTKFATVATNNPNWAQWQPVPSIEATEREAVEAFLQECIDLKMEGLMVKLLDEIEIELDEDGQEIELVAQSPKKKGSRRKVLPAAYTPDVRGDSWLKLKKDYLEGMGDSLDLVPIGAWHGLGRKAQWWSPILLACYDPESDRLVALCKCMSGFTDAFYKDLNERYAEDGENTTRSRPEGVEAGSLTPTVWFKPSEVWEVRGADFTISQNYPAARELLGENGMSLRFPRFIRLRDDKGTQDATTDEQLAEMYRAQMRRPSTGTKGIVASAPARDTGEEGGTAESGGDERGSASGEASEGKVAGENSGDDDDAL